MSQYFQVFYIHPPLSRVDKQIIRQSSQGSQYSESCHADYKEYYHLRPVSEKAHKHLSQAQYSSPPCFPHSESILCWGTAEVDPPVSLAVKGVL